MKVINKEMLVENNLVKQAWSEREILLKTTHPFLIALESSFQTTSNLHLLTEFCPGGELYFYLK